MKKSLIEYANETLTEERFETIMMGKSFRMERIVSDGQASPDGFWYDQEQNEWVLLVSGSATLEVELEGELEQVDLQPGDYLLIPRHQRHRVVCTDKQRKTIWLAIHFE